MKKLSCFYFSFSHRDGAPFLRRYTVLCEIGRQRRCAVFKTVHRFDHVNGQAILAIVDQLGQLGLVLASLEKLKYA